jgi:hypothetical protein
MKSKLLQKYFGLNKSGDVVDGQQETPKTRPSLLKQHEIAQLGQPGG